MLGIIAKNVKTRLEKRVKGEVKSHIVKDTLIVDIFTNGKVYRYTERLSVIEITNGLNSETIANEILYQYAKFIKGIFFK